MPLPKDHVWEGLVGLSGEAAKNKILADFPEAQVDILKQNGFYTEDFRSNRVRVFVDDDNIVVIAPSIG